MSCRIVVADDHPLFREGLVAAVAAMPGMEVVGEAGDGEEALELVRRLHPDVVVMDLHMPGMGGIEATRALRRELPGVAVLVLTMREGDASVAAALRAGARGYLAKGADRADIRRALEVVCHGGAFLSAGLAERMPLLVGAGGDADERPFPQLSAREHDVLELVARGLSNSAIAARLFLSPKTVRNVVSILVAKLNARDRNHAIELARDAGLGEDD